MLEASVALNCQIVGTPKYPLLSVGLPTRTPTPTRVSTPLSLAWVLTDVDTSDCGTPPAEAEARMILRSLLKNLVSRLSALNFRLLIC
jgi:hypothetical protein